MMNKKRLHGHMCKCDSKFCQPLLPKILSFYSIFVYYLQLSVVVLQRSAARTYMYGGAGSRYGRTLTGEGPGKDEGHS